MAGKKSIIKPDVRQNEHQCFQSGDHRTASPSVLMRTGITDARIYEKNNNDMELPGGAEFMSPHVMAPHRQSIWRFDYAFTITDKDHTRFNVGYTDYVRSGDEKGSIQITQPC